METTGNDSAPQQRLPVLDGLRGIAILGILIMNIQAFARIERAYVIPNIYEPMSLADRWWHAFGYFFAEQIFISLLSCLFGVGIWLLAERSKAADLNPVKQQRKRSLGLLSIGLVHAYLIWSGDILVAYAIAAWVLAPAIKWQVRTQMQLGLAFLAVIPVLSLMEMSFVPVEIRRLAYDADPQAFQTEITALLGGWWDNQGWRFERALTSHYLGLPFGTFWFVAGWMLLGMALYRLGLTSGQWASRRYVLWLAVLLPVGLLIKALGYIYQAGSDFDPTRTVIGRGVFSYLGAACLCLSLVCLATLLWRQWPQHRIARFFEAIGKTALSNYLLQSLMATSLFYGFGLGWFQQCSFSQLVLVTIGIWACNGVLTLVWLRYFRLGPVEWLWRWQSRGSAPALLKR
ncbi:hypothetical protein BGP77_13805 [Saccharospirillum sp. MSK14-1]|uniref:DUF418 domain-containing protein n=1 Tax=Saccharospirillum sp. MSK14-1 TaxID=1897632 RepID=UPI000D39E142|nr:DUF418 domain-containing protein [Saccharospirillum sp. MSK14-1]PTY37567.1 hypothetical protein BGP77_13805 [Saccharospirillum sp. MSK14-1]